MSARLGDSDEMGQLTLGSGLRQFGGFSGGGTGGGASFARQPSTGWGATPGAAPSNPRDAEGPGWTPGPNTSIP